MIKLIWLLLLASIACKMATGRWPWELLRQPARSADIARARSLLGVSPGARREDIIAAHRQLIALVHPDRGGNAALVHEADAARDLLLAQLKPELS